MIRLVLAFLMYLTVYLILYVICRYIFNLYLGFDSISHTWIRNAHNWICVYPSAIVAFIFRKNYLDLSSKILNRVTGISWFEKLKNRWKVTGKQVILILLVFALTGSTIAFLKKPVVTFFTGGEKSVLFSVIYFILIFPVYILFLLAYGYLFGMYDFFKEFAKKSISRFRKKH